MTQPEQGPAPVRVGEVLLVTEGDAGDNAAVALAVALARRFDARLTGLLIENEDLLRAAALPFAFEIGRTGGGEWMLSPASLEQRFREAAHRLGTALSAQTGAAGVEVRSVRGQPLRVLTDHASAADVVVFCRSRHTHLRAAGAPVRLEPLKAGSARLDAAMHALRAAAGALPWERLPWTGDPRTSAQLRRRRPSLVIMDADTDALDARLRELTDAVDCPIVLLR